MFEFLVFGAAFLIEGIGSYISIVGLSALFSTNPVIIALALSLDIAKVITVSFLYKQWKNINTVMKVYMTVAAVILMVITSSGAAGYLSAEFQKAMMPTKESDIVVQSMVEEKTKLEARKIEIDTQISQLPAESIKGRQRLSKQFEDELSHINTRVVEIDKALPELKVKQVDVNAHAGPILYIAQAFNTTIESAVKYVILLIIFVFDPLAIALIIAGNFLSEQNKKEREMISQKLDEIKKEVDHIEESITSPLHDIEVNTQHKEVAIDDSHLEDAELELKSLTTEESHSVDTKLAKRQRGRPKKDEAEPKPLIVSEDQLESVGSNDFSLIDDLLNEIDHETGDTPGDKQTPSMFNSIDENKADITFIDSLNASNNSWKPSKKVEKIYFQN